MKTECKSKAFRVVSIVTCLNQLVLQCKARESSVDVWDFLRVAADDVIRLLLPFIHSILISSRHWPHNAAPIVEHFSFFIFFHVDARVLRIASGL